MKKSVLAFVVMFIIILNVGTQVFAAETPIKVYVNGVKVEFQNNPIQVNGVTLVPFAPIFKSLGLVVSWDQATKTVTGTRQDLTVQLMANNKTALINAEKKALDVAPRIVNGTFFVPLRFVSQATNNPTIWDAKSRTIQIGSNSTQPNNSATAPNNNSSQQNNNSTPTNNNSTQTGNNSSTTTYDFRNTNWGMSAAQVKKTETAHFVKEDNTKVPYLYYDGEKIGGLNVGIVYSFDNDVLVMARYVFLDSYKNLDYYLEDYDDIFDFLTEKYGKPTEDLMYWKEGTKTDDKSMYSKAMANGNLDFLTEWNNGATTIQLGMYGEPEEQDIYIEINYISNKLYNGSKDNTVNKL